MEIKTFNILSDFYDFIDNYEGDLRIQQGKVYAGDKLIAQCNCHK